MRFEWDEKKNRANIQHHQLDFKDAWKVFQRPVLKRLDERKEYGEDRWVGIGMLDQTRVIVVVFTHPSSETTRIISMRKALNHERKKYEETFRDEFDSF